MTTALVTRSRWRLLPIPGSDEPVGFVRRRHLNICKAPPELAPTSYMCAKYVVALVRAGGANLTKAATRVPHLRDSLSVAKVGSTLPKAGVQAKPKRLICLLQTATHTCRKPARRLPHPSTANLLLEPRNANPLGHAGQLGHPRTGPQDRSPSSRERLRDSRMAGGATYPTHPLSLEKKGKPQTATRCFPPVSRKRLEGTGVSGLGVQEVQT